MLSQLKILWFSLKGTYWFVPSAMVAVSAFLALVLVQVDQSTAPETLTKILWIHSRDPQGARDLLSLIAGSMITVAGVVFSINLVALTLASNQFGTRVLRSFVRDTGNQVTLGVFLGTFLYCMLVMRSIQVSDQSVFIPYVSMAVGMLFSVASIVVLIYFLHHIVTSIQSENVVSAIGSDLRSTIDVVFPAPFAPSADSEHKRQAAAFLDGFPASSTGLHHPGTGYLQEVDCDRLVQLAQQHDLRIRMDMSPGEFVDPASVVARISPANRLNDSLRRGLCSALTIGVQRTYSEDVGFGFQQLVYVTVRALSPGMNDHGTATSAIDFFGAAMIRLGSRSIPSSIHKDRAGRARLYLPLWTPASGVSELFTPLRFYSLQAPNVARHLYRTLRRASDRVQQPDLRDALRRELALLEEGMRTRNVDSFRKDEVA